MRGMARVAALLIALGLPASAWAVPLVTVDADPGAVGAQPAFEIGLGEIFDIDIRVEDVTDLNGFQFTLAYDPAVLVALDVTDGGFLLAPTFELDKTLGAVSVSFSEITLSDAGASGAGVLARLSFQAVGLGSSALDLVESADIAQTLILTAAFGEPICGAPGSPGCTIFDGAVRVVEAGSPAIPEPSALTLFIAGSGLVGLSLRRAHASGSIRTKR